MTRIPMAIFRKSMSVPKLYNNNYDTKVTVLFLSLFI